MQKEQESLLASGQELRKRSRELNDKSGLALNNSTKAIREGLRLQAKAKLEVVRATDTLLGFAIEVRVRSENAVQATKGLESKQSELIENHRKVMAAMLGSLQSTS